jgi:hypothetical protein
MYIRFTVVPLVTACADVYTMYTLRPMMKSCLASLLLLAACGADGLDRDDVTSIPAGSATGAAASGAWAGTLTTTACSGKCLVKDFVSLCDIGEIDEYDLAIVQADGRLTLEAEGLDTPSMVGGIEPDGAFHVGGYATELGGTVELLSEATGVVEGDAFTATVRATARGSYDGEDFACDSDYSTRGERR